MKRLLFIAALSLVVGPAVLMSALAADPPTTGRWEVQKSGVDDDLYAVAFPTDQVGVAVGANRTIVRTTDGGTTWKRVMGPEKQRGRFSSVVFADDKVGWVRNEFTWDVYRTADGGATWTHVKTPKEGSVYAPSGFSSHSAAGEVYFWQNSNGRIGGNRLYKTTDGGKTWISVWETDGKLGGAGVSLDFPDAKEGWMASVSDGVPHTFHVGRSSDGGKTWTAQQVRDRVKGNYMLLDALDKDRGWFTSHFSNVVFASEDGGKSWTPYDLGNDTERTMADLRFVDAKVGHVLCGDHWHVRQTTDGGKTWQSLGRLPDVPKDGVRKLAFRSDRLGWVVGAKGYIARYQAGK